MNHGSIPLAGKKALVLGAGSPAGRAIAVALAEAGADVAVASSSIDGEEVMASRRTRRAVEGLGRRTAEYAFDVTLGQNVAVSTRQVAKEMGGLDILVYAVATSLDRPAEKITDAEWTRSLAVNLSGAFFTCRAALREMLATGGGRILLVAVAPDPAVASGATALATAHHGLVGLARSLALEYAGRGISADVIALGGALEGERQAPPATSLLEGVLGLGALAVYLAAEDGSAVSGRVLHADDRADAPA